MIASEADVLNLSSTYCFSIFESEAGSESWGCNQSNLSSL